MQEAYHFEEAFQEAAKIRVLVDLCDVMRLLSITVSELAGMTGIWQID